MKNKLIGFTIAFLLILGFCWMLVNAFDRSYENKCSYWETLDYPTQLMKDTCPNHFKELK